ncbi:unnamed protein product, partial [Thelazia callipaeda]|uniref:Uncharacterized protein n=1 Tax=Thelazia callipaeda TaxID=103827 RepID=A0A0N5DBM4_THECL
MQDMVARSLDGKYTNLRRCRSLPHINMTRRDGQY